MWGDSSEATAGATAGDGWGDSGGGGWGDSGSGAGGWGPSGNTAPVYSNEAGGASDQPERARSRSPRQRREQLPEGDPVIPGLDRGLMRFGQFLRLQPRNVRREQA
jgi:hypothetical protein